MGVHTDDLIAAHQRNVLATLVNLQLEALLVTIPENRRYLTGFRARETSPVESAGWLLLHTRDSYLVTGFTECEGARHETVRCELVRAEGKVADSMLTLMRNIGIHRLGFESDYLTFAQYQKLSEGLGEEVELVPTHGIVERFRVVKDAMELASLRKAIRLTDDVMDEVMGIIRPGMTEREVAWELDRRMWERGADGLSFETLVASGPNSAVPHAKPTDRPIAEGEPVFIDVGARMDGYCADLTRSVCLGEAGNKFRELYALVLKAQETAIHYARPGLSGAAIDTFARDIIAGAGYGDAFGHGLGHGIGLAVHESPRIASKDAAEPIAENMVFAVEPGVYLPGWGGIRIEDVVLATPHGVEVLSKARKDMVI